MEYFWCTAWVKVVLNFSIILLPGLCRSQDVYSRSSQSNEATRVLHAFPWHLLFSTKSLDCSLGTKRKSEACSREWVEHNHAPHTLSEKLAKLGSQKYFCKNFQNHSGFGVVLNHCGFMPNWIFAKKDCYQGCQGVDLNHCGSYPKWFGSKLVHLQGCLKPFWFIASMAH